MPRGLPEGLSLAGRARWVLANRGPCRLSTLAEHAGAQSTALLHGVLHEDLRTGRIYTNKGIYHMNENKYEILDVLKHFAMTRVQLEDRLHMSQGGVSKRLRHLRVRALIRIVDWERVSNGLAPIYGLSDGTADAPMPDIESMPRPPRAGKPRARPPKVIPRHVVAPRTMYDQLGAR